MWRDSREVEREKVNGSGEREREREKEFHLVKRNGAGGKSDRCGGQCQCEK